MIALKTRVMVKLPWHKEVMDQVEVEVLRQIGEKAVEFQEENSCLIFQALGEGKGRQRNIPLTC